MRRAIESCGRRMLLSLSPGATPLTAAADAARNANMWRISDDFLGHLAGPARAVRSAQELESVRTPWNLAGRGHVAPRRT